MKHLSDVARPGLMISQTWPTSRERRGHTLQALETALESGFFQAFQTVEIPYAAERKNIANLLHSQDIPLTYCLARVLNENRLNLSDLDDANRKKSYEKVIQCLDDAREAGAIAVSFISGPQPLRPEKRQEALMCLKDSLVHICRAAQTDQPVKIVLEPLDVDAHKKGTLGTTEEAVGLCNALQQEGLDLWLCLDTAHIILNGEDPVKALAFAQSYVAEYHYCNCVTDRSHPLFGDRHLPFRAPGVMDVESIANIMRESMTLGFFTPDHKPGVFCEVLKREQDESLQVMQHCRETLQQAWKYAMEAES
jgi:sugar phosphate isomerase/epimerase